MQRVVWIYALVDPRDREVRYVGKSVVPRQRLRHHRWAARTDTGNVAVNRLIRKLSSLGLQLEMQLLEAVAEDEWKAAEQFWIDDLNLLARRPLLNIYPAAYSVDHRQVACGSSNHNAVMTEDAVRQMRGERARGAILIELATRYGISVGTASRICRGDIWKHADGPLVTERRPIPAARSGEAHHAAKLTNEQVREIRALRAQGAKLVVLGVRFGVSAACISYIARGDSWRDLSEQ